MSHIFRSAPLQHNRYYARMPPWAKNLSLTLATILLFFGSIEIALRVTGVDRGRPHAPPIFQESEDPALSYELKPNVNETAFRATVKTDRRGFRSKEIEVGKPTIAILGDSIAFGYGLQNDEMLAARLHDELEGKFNVVNAAAPGYTLAQEAAMYEHKVEMLHPEILLLIFYWNDLTVTQAAVLDAAGNLQAPGSSTEVLCHPIAEGIMGLIPGRCWLDLHSAFYRTIKKAAVARREKGNLRQQEMEYRANALDDYVTDEQLQAYEKQFSKFARKLPKNLKKLFVIWPEKHLHVMSAPALRATAEKNGFAVLNLYEVFGNTPESLSWDTVHPSAKTTETAAVIIASALEEFFK